MTSLANGQTVLEFTGFYVGSVKSHSPWYLIIHLRMIHLRMIHLRMIHRRMIHLRMIHLRMIHLRMIHLRMIGACG